MHRLLQRLISRGPGAVGIAAGSAIFLPLALAALIVFLVQTATAWPTTQAEVVHVETVEIRVPGDADTGPRHASWFTVSVTYTVGDREYRGRLEGVDEQYQPGDSVTVYYDPESPHTIAVSRPTWVPWLLLGIGLGFLLIVGGIGLALAKLTRSARPPLD